MRILFVSPFLPYPPVAGGHAQIWAWVRRLSRRHQIAFVGFYERESDSAGAEEIARYCEPVRVRLRAPTPHAYSSFAQRPRWVTEFYCDGLARDVGEVVRHFRPEVVQSLSSNMAQYSRSARGIPAVVTALELTFLAYHRRVAATRGIKRIQARLDWLRMLRFEAAAFRRAGNVIAVSEREARIISAVAPRARVTAIPPGVDREQLAERPRQPVAGQVLYLGHMEHLPNLDGLMFLYSDIWPRVRQSYPSAHLVIAGKGTREQLGRVSPEMLAAMEKDRSVEIAGFVPDLASAMDAAAAMAAPLRLGSGVRNKVVEAMAAGLPVVTTRRGAEGLSVTDDRELLLADDGESFARQLVRLLGDQDLQQRLSAAGRCLAAREHDNDQLAARLETALVEAAGAQR
ncbi:MAG: glycosyltransferase family 4 protein [Armatimonadota bacterium]